MYSTDGSRRSRSRHGTLAIFVASSLACLLLPGEVAFAETPYDFATCTDTVTVCDDEEKDCCTKQFPEKTIIIPMDRCHQQVETAGPTSPRKETTWPVWCGNWTDSLPGQAKDDGMYEAYGLVYRLMQNDIPVYWLVNPSKDPPALIMENITDQDYIETDIDLWVLSTGVTSPPASGAPLTPCAGCTPPVLHLADDLTADAGTYGYKEFPVRGSAFVIAAEDYDDFKALWDEWRTAPIKAKYDFADVDMYQVQGGAQMVYQNFSGGVAPYPTVNGGPVAVTIDYPAPRLARSGTNAVSEGWLAVAKLKDEAAAPACMTGPFDPAEAVYCVLSEDDIQAGHLVNGNFQWAWIDQWTTNSSPCGDPSDQAQMDRFQEFLEHVPGIREAGHIMFFDQGVEVAEGCVNDAPMGLIGKGLAVSNNPVTEPMILRRPANLYMQFGDLPPEFSSGRASAWVYYDGVNALGYDPSHTGTNGSLVRLITEENTATVSNPHCTAHKRTDTCDIDDNISSADVMDCATYLRFEDDYQNGIVFYMGGQQPENAPSQLRMILNALIATPTTPRINPNDPPVITVAREVARSGPIVTTVAGEIVQFQGTYDVYADPEPVDHPYTGASSAGDFQFPYRTGHLRAIRVGAVDDVMTDYASLNPGDILLDAADSGMIPPAFPDGCTTEFTTACRTVFTNTRSTTDVRTERVPFSTAQLDTVLDSVNGTTLKDAIGTGLTNFTTTDAEVLISRVLAGRDDGLGGYESALGGVDRSTVAVIGGSALILTPRPKIAYVGALDGMLHAVCAEVLDPCTELGQELWAFIPRTQLQNLRHNTQRIDGSAKVSDMLIDHDGDDATADQYRTVLTFQTGSGPVGLSTAPAAVYAIDITEPASPTLLWEFTAPEDRGVFELGVGLNVAMGPIENADGELQHLTYVQTNNGGTGDAGTAGTVVTAIDTETGTTVWQWGVEYDDPRDNDIPPVPATGYPGGVAVIDMYKQGSNTHVVVATLYGEVYLLNADPLAASRNVMGTDPIFSFTEDYHPIGAAPTIYEDAGSGKLHAAIVSGGYAALLNSSWAPAAVDQYAVGFALDPLPANPYSQLLASGVAWSINLGPTRGYAQAVVSGDEIFIITDNDDVNSADYGALNNTGLLRQVNLTTGTTVQINGLDTTTMAGGAGAADVNQGTVYTGAGAGAQKVTPGTFNASGASVATLWKGRPNVKRDLWLRIR